MSSTYAVTIKYIKQGETKEEGELRDIYLRLVACHHGAIGPLTFEADSLGRCHLHGQFQARKGIRYTLFKEPYTHIYITLLKTAEDQYQWTDYMFKTQTASVAQYLKDVKSEYMFL